MNRRKKPPVIIMTVLVICFGLLFVMQAPKPGPPKPGDAPPPPPADSAPQTNVKNLPVPGKSAIAESVSAAVKPVYKLGRDLSKGPPGGPGGHGGPGGPGAEDRPAIVIDKPQPYVPQPSDTSVNSGWYTNEAPKSYAPPKPSK